MPSGCLVRVLAIPSAKAKISGGTAGYKGKRDMRFSWYIEFEVSLDVHVEDSHRRVDIWSWESPERSEVEIKMRNRPLTGSSWNRGRGGDCPRKGSSGTRTVYTPRVRQAKDAAEETEKEGPRATGAEGVPRPKPGGQKLEGDLVAGPWDASLSRTGRTEKRFLSLAARGLSIGFAAVRVEWWRQKPDSSGLRRQMSGQKGGNAGLQVAFSTENGKVAERHCREGAEVSVSKLTTPGEQGRSWGAGSG